MKTSTAYFWHIFRYCTLQPVNENELIQRIHGANAAHHSDYRYSCIYAITDCSLLTSIDNSDTDFFCDNSLKII